MRIIARLLLFLLALLLVAFLTVLLITPTTIVDALARLEQVVFAARVALVVIMYLVILGLLYARLRYNPKTESDTLAVNASGAIAAVTVESVKERVLKTVGEVPGVASVTAQLKSIRGKADIDLHVTTADDKVNIPEKQKEINRALEQVIKKQLGLQMAGRPRINIQLGSVKLPTPVATTPAPTPVVIPSTPPAPVPAPVVETRAPEPEPEPEPRRSFFSNTSASTPIEPITPPTASSFSISQPDDEQDFYAMLEEEAKRDEEALTDQDDSKPIEPL